ncbi:RasGEF domain containing protein [Tritrichomonas foetus]|uniref:RasGEF domain containing protein n=1 Tax=Tritrichomonas foetus TaxID=1144522 RepID=A0A1J4JUV2_9EUKA|nr:RasGEF domain containing protein [Tritrichomonas foetus]|eukprot:OHT01037.1 RasGEF domain containing protein [Tritrichomonas foetus]
MCDLLSRAPSLVTNKELVRKSSEAMISLSFDDQLDFLLNLLEISKEQKEKLINTLQFVEFPIIEEIYTNKKGVEAASFTQLILFLTQPNLSNLEFQNQFLMVFSAFSNAKEILASLLIRYYTNPNNPKTNIKNRHDLANVRCRIGSIIGTWLKIDVYYFTPELLNIIDIFVSYIRTDLSCSTIYTSISQGLDQYRCIQKSLRLYSNKPRPKPITPNGDENSWTLISVPAIELARQMTIYHSTLFNDVRAKELFNIAEEKKVKDSNMEQLTDHFNNFADYVTLSLLTQPNLQLRLKVLGFWIEVASELLKINNYHGVFTVVMGISHPAITRLKKSLSKVFKKKEYKELVEFCDTSDNYGKYRHVVSKTLLPCVPFIGCFKKDLIYIHERNENKHRNLIHFNLYVECINTINQIEKFQTDTYSFYKIPKIQSLLMNVPEAKPLKVLMLISQEIDS